MTLLSQLLAEVKIDEVGARLETHQENRRYDLQIGIPA